MYAIYVTFTNQLETLMHNNNIAVAKELSKNITKFVATILNNASSISIFLSFIENNVDNIATHMFNVDIYTTMLTKMFYPEISNQQLETVSICNSNNKTNYNNRCGILQKPQKKGITLSEIDCLIMATAKDRNLNIVTRNVKHYPEKELLSNFSLKLIK